jgi:hypothetical protein
MATGRQARSYQQSAADAATRCPDGMPESAEMHARSKPQRYSITSSARASSGGGTVRPSAFAVLRLMTRSNLVGCSTGMSAGLAPRNILSM